ncbi:MULTISPECIES: F510_1955 family glycosylhydrolase [unclassified Arthrobacter]|uniref:F510_1955 family glycosylhydrolase n=1 Tax=unclassified Arthrobacter TaxID=235627 RepID=UPI00298EE392|nr:exo-alpha-sialidase [Arthrobacter sp. AET 35A]
MPHPQILVPRPHRVTRMAALTVGLLMVTACSPEVPQGSDASEVSESSASAQDYPAGHIHGMSVDPGSNRVLLATHDGLFDVSESPAIQIGPTIDLMGFTTAGNGKFYASGHPGPGSDLPNPVGLIRSDDQGQTWQPLSRQGQSDFHALAATDGGIVGFDGQFRVSVDGTSWESVDEQIPAFNLAATPRDSIVLATTEKGLQRSTDDGTTWAAVPGAPLLMLTALSEGKAAGITTDGRIYTSGDAGLTWVERGTAPGEASAIATHMLDDSTLRIWVATEDSVQVSNDNGQTFMDIRSNHQ